MFFFSNEAHWGAFCQFPFWWIYFCYSSKFTGKETVKMHLSAVQLVRTKYGSSELYCDWSIKLAYFWEETKWSQFLFLLYVCTYLLLAVLITLFHPPHGPILHNHYLLCLGKWSSIGMPTFCTLHYLHKCIIGWPPKSIWPFIFSKKYVLYWLFRRPPFFQ